MTALDRLDAIETQIVAICSPEGGIPIHPSDVGVVVAALRKVLELAERMNDQNPGNIYAIGQADALRLVSRAIEEALR